MTIILSKLKISRRSLIQNVYCCSVVTDDSCVIDNWSFDGEKETKKTNLSQVLRHLLFYSLCSVSEAMEVRGNGLETRCAM